MKIIRQKEFGINPIKLVKAAKAIVGTGLGYGIGTTAKKAVEYERKPKTAPVKLPKTPHTNTTMPTTTKTTTPTPTLTTNKALENEINKKPNINPETIKIDKNVINQNPYTNSNINKVPSASELNKMIKQRGFSDRKDKAENIAVDATALGIGGVSGYGLSKVAGESSRAVDHLRWKKGKDGRLVSDSEKLSSKVADLLSKPARKVSEFANTGKGKAAIIGTTALGAAGVAHHKHNKKKEE